jgi:osmotically-inducible protein OsmY
MAVRKEDRLTDGTTDRAQQDRWANEGGGQVPGPHVGKGPKGYRGADDRILAEVCEALSEDGDIDATDIEVTVQDGQVTLVGRVDDARQKGAAEATVAQVRGVKEVHDRLQVGPSASNRP